MGSQLSLIPADGEYPPLRKVRTSRAAARKLAPWVTQRERLVLEAFVKCGPSTPDEIAMFLGLDRTAVRPRCTVMGGKGWLTVTGEERPTGLGGKALVYAITQQGFKHLRQELPNQG